MAGKPIHVIRVSKGTIEPMGLVVGRGHGVVWVPTATDVKVKIKFKNKSPVKEGMEFPGNPKPGETVSAVVTDNADFEDYSYGQPGSELRRSARPLADPVIIVRDNRVRKGKKRAKKRARKK